MRWVIDKQFDFCYGHRVWSQELDSEFSLDSCLACRHLHGHQGRLKVCLSSDKLQNAMVTDFKHLNWLKEWINNVIDHKFIIDKNDPLFFDLMSHYCKDGVFDKSKFFYFDEGYWCCDLEIVKDNAVLVEKYEGMIVVDFVPTSENISAWILQIATKKMQKLDITVESVEFWETPKSHCKVYNF
ncbi:MAG: 6-carboxytetrahydropterin synthase [Epsilonproteobacteria bacterium]|nr:6-carboxytetrahydropterin synthase [Campylobacterota bacterium]